MAGVHSRDVVLDAGCGVGGVARHIACECGAQVVGVTNSKVQIDSAAKLNRAFPYTPKPVFVFGNVEDLPFAVDSFTGAVCVNMAYHTDCKALFTELARVVVPGGWLAFDDWHITDITTEQEVKRLVETWSPSKRFYTRRQYESALKQAGWRITVACDLSRIGRFYADPCFAEAMRIHLLTVATSLYDGWGGHALETLIDDFAYLGSLYQAGKFGYVQLVAVRA